MNSLKRMAKALVADEWCLRPSCDGDATSDGK